MLTRYLVAPSLLHWAVLQDVFVVCMAGSSDEQGAVIMSEDIDLEDGLMSTHQDEEEDEDEDEEDQKLRALSEDEQAGIDALLREVSFGSQVPRSFLFSHQKKHPHLPCPFMPLSMDHGKQLGCSRNLG